MAKRHASDRIATEVQRWFVVEPLLFATWGTHRVSVDPRAGTLRSGHGQIRYNPAFIDALSDAELRLLLLAEATRLLLKHPYARRKPDIERAWLASNITLAELLRDARLPFPRAEQVFGTTELNDRFFELYYQQLLQDGPKVGLPEPGEGALQSHASAGESAADWEEDELQREYIDAKIQAAAETGAWGTLGGRLREQILATLRPRLDYRDVLRRFRASIHSAARVITRMKPSRRYGFAYPGSRRELATRLLVALDVSGSMSSQDLAVGMSIVNRFFKSGVPVIDVIQFDAEIQGEPLTLRRARRSVAVLGRGGTCFQPVMDYIDAHRGYDGLILFTDGQAAVPSRPKNRRTRVLWLFNDEASWRAMHPRLAHIGGAAFVRGAE